MRSDTPRLRLGIVGIIAVSLFATLFARLWYLQVLASPEYQVQARANQQRVIIEPAPRGRILDRNGVVLVDNRLSYVVSLDRQGLADLDDDARTELLRRLVTELSAHEPGLTIEVLERRLSSDRFSPYTPVPVADDIPEELAIYLTEHRADFGGVVEVASRALRTYPYGRVGAHILGYVGAINSDEFEARRDSPLLYQLTDEIGKTGVEAIYETELRGEPGRRVLEVDSQGRTIRELSYEPPSAGNDVYLTIDLRVQAVAEQALAEELANARERRVSAGNAPNTAPAGSLVVLDPNDGGVIAMASFPTFDPSTFTDGIDDAEWAALNDPANHYPLLNRAIQGEYAPGSTFKLVTAYAGLSSGAIAPESTISDSGVFRVPNCSGGTCTFRNAGSRAYGRVDLRRAITVSSDVYFYDLGARFWFGRDQYGDPIQSAAELFGFGADSGIPLANERSGWVPTPENKAQRHEDNPTAFPFGEWYAGDNINLSIGQGDMLVTPLQLANAYAVLANGGRLMAPNLALRVQHSGTDSVVRSYEPRVVHEVPFAPGWREALLDGFVGVTQSGEGTAAGSFRDFPNWVIAAKTGTAQVGTRANPRADTALFVAFGPAEAPQYVAAAVLEESGFGGVAAAPAVRRVLATLADPARMPQVLPGGVLSEPLAEGSDPLSDGDVLD